MRTKKKLKAPQRRGLELRPTPSPVPITAASWLDRLADLALAEGRHQRAEYFATRAAELREVRA